MLEVSFAEMEVPPAMPAVGVITGGGRVSGAWVPPPITGQVQPRPVSTRSTVGLPALLMSREQLHTALARGVASRRAVGRPVVQPNNAWVARPRGLGRRSA